MLRSEARGPTGGAANLDDGSHRRVRRNCLVAERHVMCAPVHAVHDQRRPVAELVGQPLADHPSDHRLRHFFAVDDIAVHPAFEAPVGQRD